MSIYTNPTKGRPALFKRNILLPFSLILLAACNTNNKSLKTALESITANDIKEYISVLASDEFLGRAPVSEGEEKTIAYLEKEFKHLGLEPANGDSYFQEVSLVKITGDPSMKMEINGGKKDLSLTFSKDFIAGSPQISNNIVLDHSDIIFVGYGINSPENNWNDYEGLDVKGKTVLMLVNDPGYATSDNNLFMGRAMTIYGRWTYKYEEAARQGAGAAIIIHETGAAAYPWGVVQNSWSGSQFYMEGNELSESDLQVQSWVTTESARAIFKSAGLDYDQLCASAAKPGFTPVQMKLKASIRFSNEVEYAKSNNVAAVWPGKKHPDEYVIYTAHWDHFGVNPEFKGDSILNGAVDNASGTAALLEIAKAFTKLTEKQDRSILFLSVTAEEQGLLGSKFYAKNPLFPLQKTLAEINMDALNIFGKTKDMTIIGYGNSNLDNYAKAILEREGRYVNPDPNPEKGGYFRSDHFSFAKAGVPSLYLSNGFDNVEHGKEWGLAQSEKWIMNNYHKPNDNYEPDVWKFDGMIEDVKVYFEVGYDISNSNEFPVWSPGSPFESTRNAMMEAE